MMRAMTMILAAAVLLGACASSQYPAWTATKSPLLNGQFLQTASEAQIVRNLDGQFDVNAHNPVDGQTPLVALISWRHNPKANYRLVKAMLAAGADPNLPTRAGSTEVDYAYAGETVLHPAAQEGHTPTIRLLLAHGANPNMENEVGVTPLYTAIKNGHADVVKLLLDGGADPNYINAFDRLTILGKVKRYGNGPTWDRPPNPQIIALVRQYGGHE